MFSKKYAGETMPHLEITKETRRTGQPQSTQIPQFMHFPLTKEAPHNTHTSVSGLITTLPSCQITRKEAIFGLCLIDYEEY
jgi:hypothetical protein